MPLAIEGGDAPTSDGFVTVGTARAEEFLVTLLAVGYTILLIEVACAKGHLAVATHEVLRMEGAVESLNDLAEDGLAAVSTVTTRRGTTMIEAMCGCSRDVG